MNKTFLKTIPMAISIALLSACGGGGGDAAPTPTPDTYANVPSTIADSNDYVYYKINDGKLVKTDIKQADSANSADWDVGFYRTKVLINSGESGKGHTLAALAAAQKQFYDAKGAPNVSVFTNATAANEGKTAWESVNDLQAVKQLEFKEPKNAAAIGKSWFKYDMETHKVTVNQDGGYLLRSSTGDSYAKMRITAIKTADRAIAGLTIEFAVQAKGATAYGAPSSKEYDLSTNKCIDFDSQSAVACTGSDWDLELKGYELWLNSAVNGGGKGALGMTSKPWDINGEGWKMLKSGTQEPLGSHYISDAPAGTFEASPWYQYNLTNQHKLWPNYRVYVLRTGAAEPFKYYKLQLVSYYGGANGAGRHLIVKTDELK